MKYGADQQYSEEKAALMEQRTQLASELTSTLTAIGHVDRDLTRLKKDIVSAGKG